MRTHTSRAICHMSYVAEQVPWLQHLCPTFGSKHHTVNEPVITAATSVGHVSELAPEDYGAQKYTRVYAPLHLSWTCHATTTITTH